MTGAPFAVRRVRFPAVDVRIVTGLALVAVSVLGGLQLARDPAPGARVWVVSRDLEVGHALSADDLEVGEVRAGNGVIEGLVGTGHGRPLGRVLRVPVMRGAALPAAALGAVVPAGRELTIPVTAEHALGGEIRAGDRIDVVASFDKGTDLARTITVARAATVRGVVRSDGLFGQSEGALTGLTLLVDPDDAVALAFASRNAEIDILRARGSLNGRGAARIDADSLR